MRYRNPVTRQVSKPKVLRIAGLSSYRHGFPPQDEERLGSLRQEARELVDQDMLNLVGLLDLDADAHRVYARLDEDALVLVARNRQRCEEDLGRGLGLDLGGIVTLGTL